MAWNEPGGNKNNQDPWGGGNKGGDQGPPDLDEALRKGMEKLNNLFGGKSGSGGGSSSSGKGFGGVLVIGLIVFLGFLAVQSFYTVDEREKAVVLRFGKFHQIVGPGLQFRLPLIDSVEKVDVNRVRTARSHGQMLTQDENIVEVVLQVQYVVSDPQSFVLKIRDPELTLTYATDSALRHEVGSAELNQVLTEGRAALAIRIQERLQGYLDVYQSGIALSKVNIEDTYAPKEVQAAFRDVQSAIEDEQREINQAEQYKNKVVPEARGKSTRLIEESSAYKEEVVARAEGETARFSKLLAVYQTAPEVTRERMYLDTLQKVMGNTSKVLVDVEGGNNMMYLPLDKMMSGSSGGGRASSTDVTSSSDVEALTSKVIEEIRARQNDSSRKGR